MNFDIPLFTNDIASVCVCVRERQRERKRLTFRNNPVLLCQIFNLYKMTSTAITSLLQINAKQFNVFYLLFKKMQCNESKMGFTGQFLLNKTNIKFNSFYSAVFQTIFFSFSIQKHLVCAFVLILLQYLSSRMLAIFIPSRNLLRGG